MVFILLLSSPLLSESKQLEKKIGPNSMPEEEFTTGIEIVGKAVCLIRQGRRELGTGFLVGKDLVFTCHHVIPKQPTAKNKVTYKFNFTKSSKPEEQPEFKFKESGLFVTDFHLDFSLIQLQPQNIEGSTVRVDLTTDDLPPMMSRVSMPDAVKDASQLGEDTGVTILQHPGGRPREVAVHGTLVDRPLEDKWLRHCVTTERGSSGSPIVDDQFRLLGIHRGATRERANKGVFIGAVLTELKSMVDSYEELSEVSDI